MRGCCPHEPPQQGQRLRPRAPGLWVPKRASARHLPLPLRGHTPLSSSKPTLFPLLGWVGNLGAGVCGPGLPPGSSGALLERGLTCPLGWGAGGNGEAPSSARGCWRSGPRACRFPGQDLASGSLWGKRSKRGQEGWGGTRWAGARLACEAWVPSPAPQNKAHGNGTQERHPQESHEPCPASKGVTPAVSAAGGFLAR